MCNTKREDNQGMGSLLKHLEMREKFTTKKQSVIKKKNQTKSKQTSKNSNLVAPSKLYHNPTDFVVSSMAL